MSYLLPTPLLAADPGSFIGIIILVIGFISWIMNLINSQQPQPPARPQRRRPPAPSDKRGRLEQEIEQFLRERQPDGTATEERAGRGPRGRRGMRPERAAGMDAGMESEIEIVDEEELRQRRIQESAAESVEQRPRLGETPLGSAIQTHLQEYLPEHRLERQVREDVPEAIATAEFDHFREYSAAPGVAAAEVTGQNIREILKDPRRVKEAIIINEVLTRRPIGGRRVR